MKKMIVALSLLVASNAYCWQFEKNPDRVPSLGFNYQGTWLSGDGTFDPVPGFVFNKETGLEDHTHAEVVDMRLPVSNNLTFEIGGGYVQRSVTRLDASLVAVSGGYSVVADKLTDDLNGPTFKVGARYYFQ